ncbi:MAG TPA: LolA-like putative outer membrane lipoprotein chaperone [Bacteroidales bacterium]|nr:LolA-like putative outer membrane lipoprotein chaperone [Bacteroidales bacterium]
MKISAFILLLFLTGTLSAQSEQEALKILDSFSAKAATAPSVSMKFDLVTINDVEKTSDTLKGSVILSGDKYRLELPDNIIFFNGQSSWSFLPAEKEVTVTNVDKDDESFMNRPSSVFSIYKNGYKSRLLEETADKYIVDLYPEDLKSELVRIRLTIGKSLDLKSLEYKRRDGITAYLNVREYDLKKKPSPDTFTFPKEKYKDVDLIDMR